MLNLDTELGVVIKGSLSDGLEMKLADGRSVEEVRAGRFVVVQGERLRFFSMVTNVSLQSSNPQILANPPGPEDTLHRQVLAGTGIYGTVELRPMLMLDSAADSAYDESQLLPVKTIPPHFSAVHEASRSDVDKVFGSAEDERFFTIGAPLEMDDTPVCLNLDRFVERSNAIFGKSGTGKTFLTRLCLCGTIKQKKAVNLVFDMHNEYGFKGTTEDQSRGFVRGLKQYFESDVLVYSLDRRASERRGVRVERQIQIPYSRIEIEDIALLERELNLNPTAVETGALLLAKFGQNTWLNALLGMSADDIKDFCDETGAHSGAVGALKRKLNVLAKSCEGFLVEKLTEPLDAVEEIIACLLQGKHVVVEFPPNGRPLQYMLVANMITRRIHEKWVERKQESERTGSGKATPLVITIEEAHKFLSPALADQTIFGTIAREMRKYDVTLLIVDQRPSGIDAEILSQVGTKLVCLLDDERDIDAVLTGTSNARGLRSVLAGLDTKQQALIMGHAVPMPIVIKTRTYDDAEFCKAMGYEDQDERSKRLERDMERDFA